MNSMFRGCSSLTSLDVSGFDTANVTQMQNMFNGCSSLTSLDVSGFDTTNVTSMDYMFHNCSSLTSLDLSGFDTSEVTSMSTMFHGCKNLTILKAPNSIPVSISVSGSILDRESLLDILDSLATVVISQTLWLGATLIAKLTEEEIASAVNKGWTVA